MTSVGTALTADDVLAIRDIASVWNVAEDDGDAARWTDLFVADGVSVYGNGRVESGRETLGRAAEARAVDERMFPWSHWTLGDPTVEPTDDGALLRHSYATVTAHPDGSFGFQSLSERVYRVRRDAGRWRIVERTIHPIPLGLAPDPEDRTSVCAPVVTEPDGRSPGAADRIAIEELLTRAAVAEDTGAVDGMADLFVAAGATVNGRGAVTSGRPAIAAAAVERWLKSANHQKVHFAVNVLVEAAGDGAVATSYNVILAGATAADTAIESVVVKHDRVARDGGTWRFVERRVAPLDRVPRPGRAPGAEVSGTTEHGAVSAADRQAIQDLLTWSAIAADTGDHDRATAAFADDGRTVGLDGAVTAGRDAIGRRLREQWDTPGADRLVHWNVNTTITSTVDGAHAHSYGMVVALDGAGRGRIDAVVAQHDELRRVDGGWRFVERLVRPIGRELRAAH